MEAIKQFILNWFIPIFTALKEAFSFDKKEETPKEPPESQHVDLRKLYDATDNPIASYKVFHTRVCRFGWPVQKAIKTPDSKGVIQIAGEPFTLRQIYDSAESPKVKYTTFYMRVMRSNWDIDKALNTPVLSK